jgi:hypothetical protein
MPSFNKLIPNQILGTLECEPSPAPLPEGIWYRAQQVGDGLVYTFPAGALVGTAYLSADFLLEGLHLAVFLLELQEGEDGPVFGFGFGLLNECQARLRMPLEAVNGNRWRYDREGALLKPRASGERVDLHRVDRLRLRVTHKSNRPARWCMTPLTASLEEPPRLANPLLSHGPLLDELGQSTLHEWPAKTRTSEELVARLQAQAEAAPRQRWPETFSRWGGWQAKRVASTGFFRTHHDGNRWWLVDPEGCLFWSTGLDCVRVDTVAPYEGLEKALAWKPDPEGPFQAAYQEAGEGKTPFINYLAANFIRAFGPEAWYARWAEIALSVLRGLGFNTVANWSDWQIASRAGLPYVRPLAPVYQAMPTVYRDFPDVFHPDFPEVCARFAEPLCESAGDPALIGYFLMNEPTWGFASETPAAGMLFNTPACHSRKALRDFLQQRYGGDAQLAAAWNLPTTLDAVAEGAWRMPFTPTSQADLADFSAVMVEKFFGGLSAACRKVDPNHLNLGIRYYTIPPAWAQAGMRHFDVFSMNCYRPRLPAEEMAHIAASMNQPILIGEWHFGALDAGLPACGIGHVPDQEARGKAFRFYLEDAAAKSWCVGVHYFTLYDQSALGRFDGENYNIGFLDVCNRPYESLAAAARLSHERLYEVAAGHLPPIDDAPEYLPLIFM